ncbi:ABC transporter ATP-binding protein [Geminicoccus roseus]|uniref:ABC transporter ATP-binding protein n=1 Tax=Geminicoccus roseus TaxID=404900 RepID=UPI00041D93FC|nr:ABC transporter ATP-binding protein [Geminicoccus roseus]
MLLEMTDLRIDGADLDGQTVQIVKGVSLSVDRGQVLGLIGESGAGKSTIGLAALGYVRPGCHFAGGSVRLDGQELIGASEDVLMRIRGQKVAYVAQSAAASFNPAHRLIDQICEVHQRHGLGPREEAEQRAVELFAKLGLPEPEIFGQRYPHQVSGGQLQRAMTVMALIAKPDLVVFDEPTTALDVTTQIEVLAAMRTAIRDEGTAALYVTHDLAVVAQVADRILVLRHGKAVELGDTAQVLEEPRQDYTKALVSVRRAETQTLAAHAHAPVLEVRSVDAAYGRQKVLFDVSVLVERGATVAVVGESGSGKSTLARVVTGLLPAAKGEVLFQGEKLSADLAGRSKEQRRRLQLIYQMPDVAVNPRQTVLEIIGRPLTFYAGITGKEMRRRVEELLATIELPADFADRFPGELSGGQKQRICIARALAAEPELIICDEVTSALDPLVADEILKLLLKLQEEIGLSYLFITHDLATVRAIAHEVVVMQRGRVVDSGSKSDVMAPPFHDYTGKLLRSVPEMRTDWLDEVLEKRD